MASTRIRHCPLGQDLDIAGGAGALKAIPVTPIARTDAVPAALLQSGGWGGSLQQQLTDYNQGQWANYQGFTGYELSTTHNLTSTYLSQAATALGTGDVATAASRVAAAAALDVGTGLQVSARADALIPLMVGGDFDIAGGGAELVQQPVAIASK